MNGEEVLASAGGDEYATLSTMSKADLLALWGEVKPKRRAVIRRILNERKEQAENLGE